MSIALLMQQLRDAGAPMEAILIAVAAVEAVEAKHRDAEEVRKADQRERTARCRARSRDRNVTVTSQQRDPAPKDNNQTPTQPISPTDPDGSVAPKGARTARKPRNRALPADWHPGERSERVRGELGRSVEWMHRTAAAMRTWAESKGELRADWDATHDGWMRREAGREGDQPPPRPSARASPSRPRSSNGFYDLIRDDLAGPDDQRSDPHRQHLRIAAGGRH